MFQISELSNNFFSSYLYLTYPEIKASVFYFIPIVFSTMKMISVHSCTFSWTIHPHHCNYLIKHYWLFGMVAECCRFISTVEPSGQVRLSVCKQETKDT